MQQHYYLEYERIEEEHWWFRARRQILRAVLEREALWGRGLSALDLGSGTCHTLAFLQGGMRAVGSDLSPEAIAYAAGRQRGRLVQCDAGLLPFRASSFDVVTALDIIEHLEDEGPVLAEVSRVLKPDGRMVITVPALSLLWSDHDRINKHQRRYIRGELIARLEASGFTTTRCSYFNSVLFAPIFTLRVGQRLMKRIVDVSRRDDAGELRSDFSRFPWLKRLPERLMALEAPLVARFDLPIGVSLLAVARRATKAD